MRTSRTARRIRRFIEGHLLEEPYDGDALADGVLDSLAIEQLIAYLEDRYSISFEEEETVLENFASMGALAEFVDAKRKRSKGDSAATALA